MTQAKSPDVSEMTIRMDAISPDAEQQLDALSWESQQAVLRRLFNRTIWRRDCKRVTKLSGNRVFRLRVTESVRICFIHFGQQHCIVNIGTHRSFEHFHNTFHGSLPTSFVPLSESTVMKNLISRSVSVAGNGHKPAPTAMPHNQPLDSSPVYQEAQRIGFALIELLETGMEGHQSKIDDDIVAHVQLMKDEVDKQLSLLAESAKGQKAATQKHVSEIGERISAMHKVIEAHSCALARITGKVAAASQAQVNGSQQQQSEMESIQQTTKRLTQRLDQLASRLGEVRKEAISNQEQVRKDSELQSTRIESVEKSQSASEAQIGQLELQTTAQFEAVDARMNGDLDAVSTLDCRVVALETVVHVLELEALRPAKSWRDMLTRLRKWRELFSEVIRRLFKHVRIGKSGRSPLETPIELRRIR